MRKLSVLAIVCLLIAVVAFFLKDGPLGPPIFTDEVGGNFIIYAPVWTAGESAVKEYASYACLTRYFNTSVVKIELQPASFIEIGSWIKVPVLPRWVEIYCSP